MLGAALLGVDEMYRADAAAMAGGVSGDALMEAAGAAVAKLVAARWPIGRVVVLCGPGNNGGDGFVAARLLAAAGRDVGVVLLGAVGQLKGDAAANAARWVGRGGTVEALAPEAPTALAPTTLASTVLDGAGVVIDAMFGAGLTRALDGAAAMLVEAVGARRLPCVAVDVPSGVHGDTGAILGAAVTAAATVTFFRRKPGHLLLPGRLHCGAVSVADIGIPAGVLDAIAPATFANGPAVWRAAYPWPQAAGHKYARGLALINGGGVMTGAARLAARGALRAGAGLVTIASPATAAAVYRGDQPGVIVREAADSEAFAALVGDPRTAAILVGPGNGVGVATAERVTAALASGKPCVLDADALSSFAGRFDALAAGLGGACVLTPHEGEFRRLFNAPGSKLSRGRAAAAASGAVVLLKGADTVVAAPDGRASINCDAPATLATAGSGDVLAGFVVALLAQGMAPFEAASAAVWLHGAAAVAAGPGLIAEDLPDRLPAVLARLV